MNARVFLDTNILVYAIEEGDLALELCGRCQIGYYDALILSAARLAGCSIIYSEHLYSGQDYGGVLVQNPFVASAG